MKKLNILNIVLLSLIIFIVIIILFLYVNQTQEPTKDCLSIRDLSGIKLESCFNQDLNTTTVKISKESENKPIEKITFFYNSQSKEFTDLPQINESKEITLNSYTNPKTIRAVIDLQTNIEKCDNSIDIPVYICEKNNQNVSFNLENETNITPNQSVSNSDTLPLNLFTESQLYELGCESEWSCSNWENCIDGVQRRVCEDTSKCKVQTSIPVVTQSCRESCTEDWRCSWSKCTNGYTTATCEDANKCGSIYSKPTRLECTPKKDCTPEIICGKWSSCQTDLKIVDFSKIWDIPGERSRTCQDKNNCVSPIQEYSNCSMGMNVYTKITELCNKKNLEVYDALSGKLIARMDYSDKLNINLFLTDNIPVC